MSAIEKFAERARSVARTIVLPEGQDPRVVVAANKAMEEKVLERNFFIFSTSPLEAVSASLE